VIPFRHPVGHTRDAQTAQNRRQDFFRSPFHEKWGLEPIDGNV
jgi:hypothetical protein